MRARKTLPLLIAAGLAVTAGCSSKSGGSEPQGSGGGEKITVVYEATGTGRADLIRYVDVSTVWVVHLSEGADLPWTKEAAGAKSDYIRLTVSAEREKDEVGCRLVVDGKEVAKEVGPTIVECAMPGQ